MRHSYSSMLNRSMTIPTKWRAPSEESDQPAHPRSLTRVFAVRSVGSSGPKVSSCAQRKLWSDQTGHTCRFARFVVRRLKAITRRILLLVLIRNMIFTLIKKLVSNVWYISVYLVYLYFTTYLVISSSRDLFYICWAGACQNQHKDLCAQRTLSSAYASAVFAVCLEIPMQTTAKTDQTKRISRLI